MILPRISKGRITSPCQMYDHITTRGNLTQQTPHHTAYGFAPLIMVIKSSDVHAVETLILPRARHQYANLVSRKRVHSESMQPAVRCDPRWRHAVCMKWPERSVTTVSTNSSLTLASESAAVICAALPQSFGSSHELLHVRCLRLEELQQQPGQKLSLFKAWQVCGITVTRTTFSHWKTAAVRIVTHKPPRSCQIRNRQCMKSKHLWLWLRTRLATADEEESKVGSYNNIALLPASKRRKLQKLSRSQKDVELVLHLTALTVTEPQHRMPHMLKLFAAVLPSLYCQ